MRRLRWYWRMEAVNVVFVPAAMIYLTYMVGGSIGAASVIAMAAMSFLLVIGAIYLRAKFRSIEQGIDPQHTIARLALLELPALAASIIGGAAALSVWIFPDLRTGVTDGVVASIAGALAVLEYVNYYKVQLQHFDNMKDFQRLLSGKGFRKAHLRRDIERLSTPRPRE